MQPISPKRYVRRPWFIGALGLIAILTAACDGKTQQQAVQPPPPEVRVTDVTQSKVPIVMEFSGTIKAIKTVDIIPRVSGYIDERHFAEGAFVKKAIPSISSTHGPTGPGWTPWWLN